MAKPYKVAVIGRTGRGAYGHGLDVVWKSIDNVEIVAVADEDAKGRAAAAERLKAKTAYADFREMLDKEKPQIVSVADRWLDRHRDMVIACAEAGASMFLENPFCRTLEEADAWWPHANASCEAGHRAPGALQPPPRPRQGVDQRRHARRVDRTAGPSMYDGRAALEMILAVYESHRKNAPVALPLENRKHPLSML